MTWIISKNRRYRSHLTILAVRLSSSSERKAKINYLEGNEKEVAVHSIDPAMFAVKERKVSSIRRPHMREIKLC